MDNAELEKEEINKLNRLIGNQIQRLLYNYGRRNSEVLMSAYHGISGNSEESRDEEEVTESSINIKENK